MNIRWTLLAILVGAGLLAGCASPEESGDDGDGADAGAGNYSDNTSGLDGFDSVMDNDVGETDEAGNATSSG